MFVSSFISSTELALSFCNVNRKKKKKKDKKKKKPTTTTTKMSLCVCVRACAVCVRLCVKSGSIVVCWCSTGGYRVGTRLPPPSPGSPAGRQGAGRGARPRFLKEAGRRLLYLCSLSSPPAPRSLGHQDGVQRASVQLPTRQDQRAPTLPRRGSEMTWRLRCVRIQGAGSRPPPK